MELIDVVDQYGNFTGEIAERKKVHDLNLPHWEVVMFVINDKKQILLQKRSSNKRYHPNKWALCAGLAISGESLEEAAVRELNEELGILIQEDELNLLEKNSNLTRFYYFVSNKQDNEFEIQKEDISEVKWYDIDDFINMTVNKDETLIIKESRLDLIYKLKELI